MGTLSVMGKTKQDYSDHLKLNGHGWKGLTKRTSYQMAMAGRVLPREHLTEWPWLEGSYQENTLPNGHGWKGLTKRTSYQMAMAGKV